MLRKEREGKRRLEGRAAETLATHRDAIEQYEDFAAELGHEPGDVGLAWLLHQPAVTAPIIGPRTQDQLDSAVRALGVTLDASALARLDEIFPGHKTAPEDYAWYTRQREGTENMKTRKIADVEVSAIGLGGMPMSIEGRPDEARSIATIHAALDAGVTLIDTADAYHLHADEVGHNESLIAQALATYGGDTTDVLVATKGGHLRPGDGSWTVDGRPEYIKEAAEASLKRLGVEAIGLYQFHRPDPAVPYEDSVGAIRDLLDEGKIRLAGISNANPDQIRLAQRDPRRPAGLGAEPVLAGLPQQRAGARAVRRAGHRLPAVEPARRDRQRRRRSATVSRPVRRGRGRAWREPAGRRLAWELAKSPGRDPDPRRVASGEHPQLGSGGGDHAVRRGAGDARRRRDGTLGHDRHPEVVADQVEQRMNVVDLHRGAEVESRGREGPTRQHLRTPALLEADHRLPMQRLDVYLGGAGERVIGVAENHELLRAHPPQPHALGHRAGRHDEGDVGEAARHILEVFDGSVVAQPHLDAGVRDPETPEFGRQIDRAETGLRAHGQSPTNESRLTAATAFWAAAALARVRIESARSAWPAAVSSTRRVLRTKSDVPTRRLEGADRRGQARTGRSAAVLPRG